MTAKRKDNRGRNLRDGEEQQANGRYRYRYTDNNGKRHTVYSWRLVSTDKTPSGKRDGECLREIIKQIEADNRDGIDAHAAYNVTFDEMYHRYMNGRPELRETTKRVYTEAYNNQIKEQFGERKISTIRYSDIRNFYLYLVTECGLMSGTLQNVHSVIHPVLDLAVKDEIIRANPADGVLGEIKASGLLEKRKRYALTIEEQKAVVRFITESNYYRHWLPMVTFMLGTGCRIGETVGLCWKDCDFKRGTININHTASYIRPPTETNMRWIITSPKTASGNRTIPMLREVRAALLEEKRRQELFGFCVDSVDGYSGFVFMSESNHLIFPSTVNRMLTNVRERYNESERKQAAAEGRAPCLVRPFSCHTLRHTFCTRLCENETNIKVIQDIMGHADIQTTMNIYAEATESKKKEEFANLEGKILIS